MAWRDPRYFSVTVLALRIALRFVALVLLEESLDDFKLFVLGILLVCSIFNFPCCNSQWKRLLDINRMI